MYLHPCRFDLMAKYLYVKAKDKNLKTDFFKELYHKHLLTFNGCREYPDKTKNEVGIAKENINDFINSFDNLIEDMKKNGYNEKHPIPIGKNGVIVNGAHRLVVSYYYNIIPKTINMNEDGNMAYDNLFFVNRTGKPVLEEIYADRMALEYIKHNENIRSMIIYPVAYNIFSIRRLSDIINQYGYIYYHKIVNLNVNGINNLVKEIYRGENWIGGLFPTGWSPGGKAERCIGHGPTIYISICMNDVNKCVELKEKCRDLFRIGKHSLHISDYPSDTWRISSALLNNNSINYLNNGTNDISEYTKKLLEQYFENDIDEDYCLTSSLILEMYGLRNANDIDYLHKDDKELENYGLHSGEWLNYYNKNKYDIIYNPLNHFYFNGCKFASLDVIKKMKERRNEEKDIIDLELISKINI